MSEEFSPSKESMAVSDAICKLTTKLGADVEFGPHPMNAASICIEVSAPPGMVWKGVLGPTQNGEENEVHILTTGRDEIRMLAEDGEDDDVVVPLLKYALALMERGLEKDPAAQGIDKKENGNG